MHSKEKAQEQLLLAVKCEESPEYTLMQLADMAVKNQRLKWYRQGIETFPDYRNFYLHAAIDWNFAQAGALGLATIIVWLGLRKRLRSRAILKG